MLARLTLLAAFSASLMVGCGSSSKPETRTARSSACTGSGYYALTYDDGPNTTYTPKVEAALDSVHANATFFFTGQRVEEQPKLAKSAVQAGDWLGNHTFTHPDLTKLSAAQVKDELTRANQAIENVTGIRPRFARPTYAEFNTTVLSVFKELNLENALWTIDPKDWEASRSVSEIVADAVKVKDRGIILLHDTNERAVEATPRIVDELKQKGLCPGKLEVAPAPVESSMRGRFFSVIAVKP